MTEKGKKALIDNSVIGLHQAFKNILNNKFTVKSTMEENKELTAEERYLHQSYLPPINTGGKYYVSDVLKLMQSYAEHHHEIKSKEEREELIKSLDENIKLLDAKNKAQARVKELEEENASLRDLLFYAHNHRKNQLEDWVIEKIEAQIAKIKN